MGKLFEKVFRSRVNTLNNKDSTELDATKTKKRKTETREDAFPISVDNLKDLLNNICELAKVDVREEDLLISNLTLIYDICEFDPNVSKRDVKDVEEAEKEYMNRGYVYKKARSIFIHEKFHINSETGRRQLFYKFVHNILKNINEHKKKKALIEKDLSVARSLPDQLRNNIVKHLMKDRKQSYLEEIIVQIEKEIQDLCVE